MQLERFFFLDDGDLGLVGRRRGDHNRLGFAVQLATVRFVGTFLADPGGVPDEVVVYVAAQLDVAPASMATYTQREKTRLEHQWEIAREVGYRDFVDAEAELAVCNRSRGRRLIGRIPCRCRESCIGAAR